MVYSISLFYFFITNFKVYLYFDQNYKKYSYALLYKKYNSSEENKYVT